MRFHDLLPVSLIVVPALVQAQPQPRLSRPIGLATAAPVVAAQVTIPALAFSGNLGGVYVNLAYDHVGISAGGAFLLINGPSNSTLASTIVVSGNSSLPAGTYNVKFDFVNVAAATQLSFNGANSASLGTCSLASGPGYNTVQSCQTTLTISGGIVMVSLTPLSGNQMTLKQVTVTRYQ